MEIMKIQSVKNWHTLLGGMAIYIPICNRLAMRLFVSGIICFKFNGHFRILNWYSTYHIYPPKIWPYMVQYLHFRILDFPLINGQKIIIWLWAYKATLVKPIAWNVMDLS